MTIIAANAAGNMAAPLLAQALGGDLLMSFVSAVAFATILAVVAGLVLSGASAFAHDIYGQIIKKGKVTEKEQMSSCTICFNWRCCFLYYFSIRCTNVERCILSFTCFLYCSKCKLTSNYLHDLLEKL